MPSIAGRKPPVRLGFTPPGAGAVRRLGPVSELARWYQPAAAAIARKSAAFRLAPPTSAPSTFGTARSSPHCRLHRAAIEDADRPPGLAEGRANSLRMTACMAANLRRSASGRCRSPRPAHRPRQLPAAAPSRQRCRRAALPTDLGARPPSRSASVSPTQTIGGQAGAPARPRPWPASRVGLAMVGAALGMADDDVGWRRHPAASRRRYRRYGRLRARRGSPAPPTAMADPGRRPTGDQRKGRADQQLGLGAGPPFRGPLRARDFASARLPFIFQLPAISGRTPGVMASSIPCPARIRRAVVWQHAADWAKGSAKRAQLHRCPPPSAASPEPGSPRPSSSC